MKPPIVLDVLEHVVVDSFDVDSCPLVVVVDTPEVIAEEVVAEEVADDREETGLVVSKVEVWLWLVLDSVETGSEAGMERDAVRDDDDDEEEEERSGLSEVEV